jgi:hypothetical protein
MNRKVRLYVGLSVLALVVILLTSTILTAGCGCLRQACQPYGPRVTGDGAGGAIAIWEDLRKGLTSVYAQRIGAQGNIKWQPGGEEVCYIDRSSSFWPYMAVSDGSGGAIISFGVRAQKIDDVGNMVWPGNGVQYAAGGTNSIAYDGYGGIVAAWGESQTSYVQRLNNEGEPLWGNNGVKLRP